MTILIVGANESILKELKSNLLIRCPSANLVIKTDPLMAGKYSCNHEVDILIAETDMKRMNGPQLTRFVRHERPEVRTYLIIPETAANENLLNRMDHVTGFIRHPFTDGSLDNVLGKSLA